jgi:ligand-binding SRPBCC domain-containing protein
VWRARHFGLWFSMRVRIAALSRPDYFRDEMVQGPFRRFQHDHTFTQEGSSTIMFDNLRFESPFSLLGRTFDKLVLQAHLLSFLENRNRTLKSVAESDQWHKYL